MEKHLAAAELISRCLKTNGCLSWKMYMAGLLVLLELIFLLLVVWMPIDYNWHPGVGYVLVGNLSCFVQLYVYKCKFQAFVLFTFVLFLMRLIHTIWIVCICKDIAYFFSEYVFNFHHHMIIYNLYMLINGNSTILHFMLLVQHSLAET
jgi:hypothetical protein